ncbi:MAG: helix-turn-helix transcriptional regulator [Actinobacteria bacterium]|nr:helix-turn-helix transcriptional regulator [Actinomycetota bacterium]
MENYIKELRLKNNISLQKVKRETGLSIKELEKIESDNKKMPSVEILKKLMLIYNVSLRKIIINYDSYENNLN